MDFDLKAELKRLGMTQKEFADIANIHHNTVSQWIRGEREMPKWVPVFLKLYEKSEALDKIVEEIKKLKIIQ